MSEFFDGRPKFDRAFYKIIDVDIPLALFRYYRYNDEKDNTHFYEYTSGAARISNFGNSANLEFYDSFNNKMLRKLNELEPYELSQGYTELDTYSDVHWCDILQHKLLVVRSESYINGI